MIFILFNCKLHRVELQSLACGIFYPLNSFTYNLASSQTSQSEIVSEEREFVSQTLILHSGNFPLTSYGQLTTFSICQHCTLCSDNTSHCTQRQQCLGFTQRETPSLEVRALEESVRNRTKSESSYQERRGDQLYRDHGHNSAIRQGTWAWVSVTWKRVCWILGKFKHWFSLWQEGCSKGLKYCCFLSRIIVR